MENKKIKELDDNSPKKTDAKRSEDNSKDGFGWKIIKILDHIALALVRWHFINWF